MPRQPYGEMPGPRQIPWLGNGHQLWRAPLRFPSQWIQQYGDVVRLGIPGHDAVLLGHPEQVRTVLEGDADRFVKGTFYREQLDIFDSGLLVSEGELWRNQRELMRPQFTPGRVAAYTETMVQHVERTMEAWSGGESVRMESAMQRLALAIIADTLCSVDISAEVPQMRGAIRTVMRYRRQARRIPIRPPTWVPTPRNRRYQGALETFDEVVEEIIADHEGVTDPPDDVVTALLEARAAGHEQVTNKQIRDEILTMLLAGHDTTALAAAFSWHLLASHPEIQARARAEVDRVLGGDRFRTEHVSELVVCGRIIDETLRLYPPVYHFARETSQEELLGDYRVPAGTVLLLHPWTYHRDRRWFAEPDRFRPDRWAIEEADRPRHAYIPFGAGPRRCLGERIARLELLVILATGLREFRFETAFDPEIELAPSLSLRPAESIEIELRAR